MTLLKLSSIALLAASCGGALAQPPEGAIPPIHQAGERHPGPPPHGLLRGVALDAAQDDKVFAILHTLEPQRREQQRALRQAQDALRAMAVSGQYDETRAAALAKAAGVAWSALALLDARADARILAVMTPEQRRAAEERAARPHPRFDK